MSALVLAVVIGLPLILAAATVVWALFSPCKCERCRAQYRDPHQPRSDW